MKTRSTWALLSLSVALLSACVTTPEPSAEAPRVVMSGDCDGCHGDRYNESRFGHAGVGFERDCAECHDYDGWSANRSFDHSVWPRRGAHGGLECLECHTAALLQRPEPTCLPCHDEERARAEPNHSFFPVACEECHSTAEWLPSGFNHDQFFVREGAHQRVSCVECHPDGRYEGTPQICVGCHAEDALNIDPDHERFSADCLECHNQEAWVPWEVYHIFPVKHESNERCEDCHSDAPDFSAFYCTSCHKRGEMDYEHHGVRRYRYANFDCFRCHPRGRE